MANKGDVIAVLEEVAQSLKESAEETQAQAGGDAFADGRLMGYYEALSTLVSQCEVAGISTADLGLGDRFSAESILKRNQAA